MNIWKGFEKKAKDSKLFPFWDKELQDKEQELKDNQSNKRFKIDPTELADWKGPECYYRYGP
jgi:hypothetical protein